MNNYKVGDKLVLEIRGKEKIGGRGLCSHKYLCTP